MDITRTTVPGVGVVHHFLTRGGQRFGVLVDQPGRRSLLLYGPDDPDVPVERVPLDHDEADQIAEVLHSTSVADRLASLERRLADLHGGSA
ncbi:hypothetical protein [Plantactinospora endophytica]|uniref:Potassium/proton antiporter subunit KhtT-like N-terminal domain-containing protein n=1 Tax=Plantactinospora endophytica TaxID=673535 RepID=A0ABQ4E6L2_9ACTN|nr:hypothetical protein [Plantactinospora endophytica]GIG90323.1 hypothetical protein Pen02_52590 [Plantactinospora endophytica]